jgi:hypothetical protein
LKNRFAAYGYSSFSQQIFNVSVAEIESIIEPDSVADDGSWKSVALVGIHVPFYQIGPVNLSVPLLKLSVFAAPVRERE